MLVGDRGTTLAVASAMIQENESSRLAALRVWECVWAGIERLVHEAREALGSHLREGALDARRRACGHERAIGELIVGRTVLRLECALDCAPASPRESLLHDVFGGRKPLVRVHVFRDGANGVSVLEAVLGADPATGIWVATEPDLGPARLDDLASFEEFFWTLVTDRARTAPEREKRP